MGFLRAFLGLFLLATSAQAVALGYLPEITGTTLDSLTTGSKFQLQPGELSACTSKNVGTSSFHHCDVTGAKATVQGANGVTEEYHFNRAHLRSAHVKSIGFFKEYTLQGTWKGNRNGVQMESPVQLVLWHPTSNPNWLRGSLSLKDLGLSVPVHGAP